MPPVSHRLLGLSAVLALGACQSVPGDCDLELAREVVYDEDGHPAYAGQALLHGSCGFGTFCHATDATGGQRQGAPRGLELDIDPASYDGSAGEVERLRAVQAHAYAERAAIWAEVDRGTMPPGAAGADLIANPTRPRYARLGAEPLPELDTPEGRAILRNWLACDLPVIERTRPRDDGQPATVGTVVARACIDADDCPGAAASLCFEGECLPCAVDADCAHLPGLPLCASGTCVEPAEPTWASIHEVIVVPTCAVDSCHGDLDDENEGDLDLRGLSESYDRLFQVSATDECGALGMALVTAGDPDASLFYRKLYAIPDGEEIDSSICGYRMPYSNDPLPEPWRAAIEAWITAGAPGP